MKGDVGRLRRPPGLEDDIPVIEASLDYDELAGRPPPGAPGPGAP